MFKNWFCLLKMKYRILDILHFDKALSIHHVSINHVKIIDFVPCKINVSKFCCSIGRQSPSLLKIEKRLHDVSTFLIIHAWVSLLAPLEIDLKDTVVDFFLQVSFLDDLSKDLNFWVDYFDCFWRSWMCLFDKVLNE